MPFAQQVGQVYPLEADVTGSVSFLVLVKPWKGSSEVFDYFFLNIFVI